MGVLVMDCDPTPGMEKTAVKAGRFTYQPIANMPPKEYDRIQIITAHEIIEKPRVDCPPTMTGRQAIPERTNGVGGMRNKPKRKARKADYGKGYPRAGSEGATPLSSGPLCHAEKVSQVPAPVNPSYIIPSEEQDLVNSGGGPEGLPKRWSAQRMPARPAPPPLLRIPPNHPSSSHS